MIYMKEKGHLYSLAEDPPKAGDSYLLMERIRELESLLFDKEKLIEHAN